MMNDAGQIEGNDPEHPACVEIAEVVFAFAGVDQYACDQEAGEDEEEIYAKPSMFDGAAKNARKPG
jgi:hypothetical protein